MMLHVTRGLWSCACIMAMLAICDVIGTMCELCDCLAGHHGEGNSIVDVQVRCREGTVTWYPSHGAIRLTLNPTHQDTVRVCIRSDGDVPMVVSREISIDTPTNYRTKMIGHTEKRLSPLFTSEGHSKVHCISGTGSVQLYLQTEPSQRSGSKVRVHYDVEPVPREFLSDSFEECRPCTDRELLRFVCSSDFVAVGRIDDVTHDDITSNIRVSVSRVIAQKGNIFRASDDSFATDELKGVIHAPLKCGIRHGDGQFMFMGRVRLGQPMLQCAPRYEQWKHVLERARADDVMECTLNVFP